MAIQSSAKEVKFLLHKDDIYDKHGEVTDAVKDIFNYYQVYGLQQVYDKNDKYIKLENLANGVINKENYVKEKAAKYQEFNMEEVDLDDLGIQFFPVIPVIRQSILGDYDKKLISYSVRAVNPENTNQIIEETDAQLREQMVQAAQNLFLSENTRKAAQLGRLFLF